MTYIIHGATGAQGAPLLKHLLESGKTAIAAVRHPQALGSAATVQIDNTSAQSLTEAYRGANGVFVHLLQAPEEVRIAHAHAIVQAVGTARPERVLISTSGNIVDEPGNPLQSPAGSAIAILIEGVQHTGVSSAVIAPRLFLENLLLPLVINGVRADGVLAYPVRQDYVASWCSHLDVADVAQWLFEHPEVTGVVGVGQLPGVLGTDLALALRDHLKRAVSFHSQSPEDFGKRLAPLLGPAAFAVAGFYQALWQTPQNTIGASTSAQHLLGLTPRTVAQWLKDTALR